jgi:hypothetical protein
MNSPVYNVFQFECYEYVDGVSLRDNAHKRKIMTGLLLNQQTFYV